MRETRYWTWNIAAALVILVLLGLHLVIMHLDGTLALLLPALQEPLAWPNVLARAGSAFFASTYILLLAAALYHGFYGLRTMLCEVIANPVTQRRIGVGFWLAGGGLFLLGTYALIAMHLMHAGVQGTP